MITAVGFAGAAALGALARWQLSVHRFPRPVATVLVNLTGAFALGLLDTWDEPGLTVVGIGGIGTYTTFSTLGDDVVELWRSDRRLAAGYVALTLVGGIGAAALGLELAG